MKVRLAEYPQLRLIAWSRHEEAELGAAVRGLQEPGWLKTCVDAMHMTEADGERVLTGLLSAAPSSP